MDYLVDTVALVRHLRGGRKIGTRARQILREADAGERIVTISEVFEVFFNPDQEPLIKRSPRGGGRYLALGQTQAGRYLTIAFERKNHETIEVVTARNMQGNERRWYRRRGK